MADENQNTAANGWGATPAAQGQVDAATQEQRQEAANKAAESAVVQEPEKTGEPLGDKAWSDAQKEATGEGTEGEEIINSNAKGEEVAFYRGPRADDPNKAEKKPSMKDLIASHVKIQPLLEKKTPDAKTFSNEQFSEMLAKQSPKTESPNAHNPTADNDVNVGKTAPDENNGSGWKGQGS